MAAQDDPDSIRATLARLARRKRTRKSVWTPEAPCDWNPMSVTNPDSGLPFTQAGAWDFIADHLEAGHSIEVIVLEKPPGEHAYVLLFPAGDKTIYVKLQFSRDQVLGRSFHYSFRSS